MSFSHASVRLKHPDQFTSTILENELSGLSWFPGVHPPHSTIDGTNCFILNIQCIYCYIYVPSYTLVIGSHVNLLSSNEDDCSKDST